MKESTTRRVRLRFVPCNSDAGPINGTSPLYQAFNLADLRRQRRAFLRRTAGVSGCRTVARRARLARLLARLYRFCGQAGHRHVSFVRGGAAGIRHAAESDAEPRSQRHADAGARRPRSGARSSRVCTRCRSSIRRVCARWQRRRHGSVHVPAGATEALVVMRAVGGSGHRHLRAGAHEPTRSTRSSRSHAGHAQPYACRYLGPLTQSGKATPTICPGTYEIYAAGTNYPAYEASYPEESVATAADRRQQRTGRRHDLRSALTGPIRE